jgi:dephospho-CoA kinase
MLMALSWSILNDYYFNEILTNLFLVILFYYLTCLMTMIKMRVLKKTIHNNTLYWMLWNLCCFILQYMYTGKNYFSMVITEVSVMVAIVRLRSYNLIAVTGGIGCGKSSLTNQLKAKHGWPIIDCDKISHEILTPGYMSYKLTVWYFGKEILDEDGQILRKKLGDIIHSDPKKKAKLEIFTQPFILFNTLSRMYTTFLDSKNEHAILDIPLLFETKIFTWFVFPIVTVYIKDKNIWLERIKKRDSCTEEYAQKVIDNQMPTEIKVKRSDIALDNGKTQDELYSAFLVQ